MSLFRESLNNFNDLFLHDLQTMYDAEQQIVEALPEMAGAANSTDLKNAFNTHLMQSRDHVKRLEQVFRLVGREPERETCVGMKGLIKEGSEIASAKGDASVKDAALIGCAQKVEHYEIAAYGTMRTLAQHVHRTDAADIFQQTLDEEKQADQMLTQIAESHVNLEAAATAGAGAGAGR